MDGVPGVAVAEVVLDQPQVVTLVGQREAAGVPQRVRMHAGQAGALGRRGDQVVDRLAGHGLAALGGEQPGQRVGAGGEVALDGAQLVAGDRLLDGQPAFEPAHPEARTVEVQLVAAQGDRLADSQAVAVGHEQQQVVAPPCRPALAASSSLATSPWDR